MLKWLKPMALDKTMILFSDIKASKDSTYTEDANLDNPNHRLEFETVVDWDILLFVIPD